ncbi:unnamed protein product [Prorocentrum cordatum]|uniref:Uncharacterized protein n=1 Tax=Prorocentrum cordatum TaxID=2364126 RepID=A0ABN9UZN4_9DINO|nr:unnamed protein product [Polarella glacialis]
MALDRFLLVPKSPLLAIYVHKVGLARFLVLMLVERLTVPPCVSLLWATFVHMVLARFLLLLALPRAVAPCATTAPTSVMAKTPLCANLLPLLLLVEIYALPKSLPERKRICANLLAPPVVPCLLPIRFNVKTFGTGLLMPPQVKTPPCTILSMLPLVATCMLPTRLMVKRPPCAYFLLMQLVAIGAPPKSYKAKALICSIPLMLPLVASRMPLGSFTVKTPCCAKRMLLSLVATCLCPKSFLACANVDLLKNSLAMCTTSLLTGFMVMLLLCAGPLLASLVANSIVHQFCCPHLLLNSLMVSIALLLPRVLNPSGIWHGGMTMTTARSTCRYLLKLVLRVSVLRVAWSMLLISMVHLVLMPVQPLSPLVSCHLLCDGCGMKKVMSSIMGA